MTRLVICGKGGVGKTTVSALISRHLARAGTRALLVDADHAGGLEVALDLAPTRTLNDVRLAALEEAKARRTSRKPDLAASIDYQLLETLVERDHLAFLALGRPEEDGCFCSVNTVLKRALEVLAANFDVTLIDAEAGIEQINRDVVGHVEHLLLVADASVKSLRVAQSLAAVAAQRQLADHVHLVLNRLREGDDPEALASRAGVPLIAALPDDPTVRAYDAEARSFFDLPDGPAPAALAPALARLAISAVSAPGADPA